jgi:hypothetical protein
MRQLLLEMLKEESWIETVGEATLKADIRKVVQKTAPDPVVVTARQIVQATGHLRWAAERILGFLGAARKVA